MENIATYITSKHIILCLLILSGFTTGTVIGENDEPCERIRLVDGPSENSGHVEVYHDNEWRPICGLTHSGETIDHWNTMETEAVVVCRQLGYSDGVSWYEMYSYFGNRDNPNFWLDYLVCVGNESSLEECDHTGWGYHACDGSFLFGINCTGPRTCVPTVKPNLKYTETVNNAGVVTYTPQLEFLCVFTMDVNVTYNVTWYIDDSLLVTKGPSSLTENLTITEHQLSRTSLGFQLKCVALKHEAGNNESMTSPMYHVGFQIVEENVTVNKLSYSFVTVRLTVPMGCIYNSAGTMSCDTTLVLFQKINVVKKSDVFCYTKVLAVNADDIQSCTHSITPVKADEAWDSQKTYKFRIWTRDRNYDDDKQFTLWLYVSNDTSVQTHPIWKGYKENIRVVVTNTDAHINKICYSHVDPHMRTSDGKYYENQSEGDYMLYRNTAYDIEIQESARYCYGGHSGPVCACGVAIRAGKDVYKIHRCGEVNFIGFVGQTEQNYRVLQVENIKDFHYKITTPIGTRVNVVLHQYQTTMNIDITMSAKDMGHVEGLCGSMNNNPDDDFKLMNGTVVFNNDQHVFSNSWRLSDDLNLFTNNDRKLDSWTVNNPIPRFWSNDFEGKYKCYRLIDGIPCKSKRRRRRSFDDDTKRSIGTLSDKELKRLHTLMLTPRKRIHKRNIATNVTTEEATVLCQNSINNMIAVQNFSNLLANEDPEEVIKQCVYDVGESNDPSWAVLHVDAINVIASNMLEMNPVYVANNTEIVEDFLLETCSTNCSGNGVCSVTASLNVGQCNCTGPFRGPDCSMDIRDSPVIKDIQGAGICDTSNGTDCSCIVIRTNQLFEGFYCKMTSYRLFFNGTTESTDSIAIRGVYENIYTGQCCLTPNRRRRSLVEIEDFVYLYDISVSNDGVNFGDSESMYVIDTTCNNITTNDSISYVTLQPSYCYIDGVCYADQYIDIDSECNKCDITISLFVWTLACTTTLQPDTSTTIQPEYTTTTQLDTTTTTQTYTTTTTQLDTTTTTQLNTTTTTQPQTTTTTQPDTTTTTQQVTTTTTLPNTTTTTQPGTTTTTLPDTTITTQPDTTTTTQPDTTTTTQPDTTTTTQPDTTTTTQPDTTRTTQPVTTRTTQPDTTTTTQQDTTTTTQPDTTTTTLPDTTRTTQQDTTRTTQPDTTTTTLPDTTRTTQPDTTRTTQPDTTTTTQPDTTTTTLPDTTRTTQPDSTTTTLPDTTTTTQPDTTTTTLPDTTITTQPDTTTTTLPDTTTTTQPGTTTTTLPDTSITTQQDTTTTTQPDTTTITQPDTTTTTQPDTTTTTQPDTTTTTQPDTTTTTQPDTTTITQHDTTTTTQPNTTATTQPDTTTTTQLDTTTTTQPDTTATTQPDTTTTTQPDTTTITQHDTTTTTQLGTTTTIQSDTNTTSQPDTTTTAQPDTTTTTQPDATTTTKLGTSTTTLPDTTTTTQLGTTTTTQPDTTTIKQPDTITTTQPDTITTTQSDTTTTTQPHTTTTIQPDTTTTTQPDTTTTTQPDTTTTTQPDTTTTTQPDTTTTTQPDTTTTTQPGTTTTTQSDTSTTTQPDTTSTTQPGTTTTTQPDTSTTTQPDTTTTTQPGTTTTTQPDTTTTTQPDTTTTTQIDIDVGSGSKTYSNLISITGFVAGIPIAVFGLVVCVLVTIYCVRKHRRLKSHRRHTSVHSGQNYLRPPTISYGLKYHGTPSARSLTGSSLDDVPSLSGPSSGSLMQRYAREALPGDEYVLYKGNAKRELF